MKPKQYISYYRVSTKKQGQSGLGLDAQKTICTNYIDGQHGVMINSYVEIESGKNDNREQLNSALAECKQTKSTLLIAKLDRLSRSVEFIFSLKNSGVDFTCVDLPELNTIYLHSVTQPIDISTDSGVLMQDIHFIMGKYENMQRRKKCITGIKNKLT